jgi:hypothetical protein
MLEILLLFSVLVGGVALAGAIAVAFALKALVWLVLLPFRLVLALVFVPILLVKMVIGLIAALVLIPVVLLVALTVAFLPVVFLLFVGWLVWTIARGSTPSDLAVVS